MATLLRPHRSCTLRTSHEPVDRGTESLCLKGCETWALHAFHPLESDDQRLRQLQHECELLTDGFPEIDRHLREYIREVPMNEGDGRLDDADRFLRWLYRGVPVDEQQ